jgi:hypothetical protein
MKEEEIMLDKLEKKLRTIFDKHKDRDGRLWNIPYSDWCRSGDLIRKMGRIRSKIKWRKENSVRSDGNHIH